VRYYAAIAALLFAASPAHAGPCFRTITSVQAQVDVAIENRAGSDGWKPESLNAQRGYQPTPRSIAATEAVNGRHFKLALDSLDRARAADRSGYIAVCRREVANARAMLRN
jgi:hypothetical protein